MTSTLTQQIREFMFCLLALHRPLADELHARVNWRSWQTSVIASCDLLRTRLSDAYADDPETPFFRRHRLHYRVSVEPGAPTNNLYVGAAAARANRRA